MSIKIQDLHKKYKKTPALININLEIQTGMFGLLGPNGAGKTTLMRLIMGLHHQTQGHIQVFDIDTKNRPALRQMVSYLPQEYTFYPKMTVYEAMDYMAILCGLKDKKYRKKHIINLLDTVNMLDQKNKRVKALSGGMKRRLGLAQSLIKDPKVLIVDEPTAGLDPEERLRIRNLLTNFSKDRIVIFSTHIVEDIAFCCQQLAVINKGNIVYQGTKEALIDQAKNRIWAWDIDHRDLDFVQNKYHVTTMTPHENRIRIKCIGKNLNQGQPVQASLEDAYMCLMKRCDENVQIPN